MSSLFVAIICLIEKRKVRGEKVSKRKKERKVGRKYRDFDRCLLCLQELEAFSLGCGSCVCHFSKA